VAAIFHMVTHAFFKALLFLGSGSVIHGLGGEQDMRRMGGLRKLMPVTAATFVVGWLSIAGVPPFSGFWSKDEILLSAWASPGGQGKVLWGIGLVTALLTAFYMSRQVYMVFFGKPRWAEGDEHAAAEVVAGAGTEPAAAAGAHAGHGAHGEPHESPWIMTLPLVVLAALAFVGGGLNLPFTDDLHVLQHWLEPVVGENELHVDVATATKVGLAAVAVLAALAGIAAATVVYLRRRVRAVEPGVLAHAYHYDEAVSAFVAGPGTRGFEAVAWFDAHVVDGAVNGVAHVVSGFGRRLRTVQSGFVRSYALGVATGVVVLLGYFLTRIGF
jgi:NADH-quinone oxidoreductase subunit L